MIDITFKNVGQGDSIILEWQKDLERKIGLIDCNLFQNSNPVLNYLEGSNYSTIEFIILSHPHYDHFSGMRQLLEFCEIHGIVVKKFLHTSSQVPDFLRVATRSIISSNELVLLFEKIQSLREKNIIQFITYITDETKDLKLNDELKLNFLAPSSEECEKFLSRTPLFDEEDPHNNAQANWLSTIIKIYSKDWYLLVTSDSSRQTLKRVGIQHKIDFNHKLLVLGQSPHHGASKNHYKAFWKTKKHEIKTPIVFSVGPNIYNHPSKEAIDFFSNVQNNYEIYSTNQVGSLSEFKSSKKIEKIKAYLDLVSVKEIEEYTFSNQYQGDQKFSFPKS